MAAEPIVTLKGYVLATEDQTVFPRFIEKIERTQNGIFTLECPNVEDAMIFNSEFQARTWCLIINKELEGQHNPDKYVPLKYMSALQKLEDVTHE